MNLRRLVLTFLLLAPLARLAAEPQPRPNIVFVLVDDLGWTGVGCYGNTIVPTPHIDRLAKEGAKFTAAYALPQCSPTRFAFMTGQWEARTNHTAVIFEKHGLPHARLIQPESNRKLDKQAMNVARMLTQAGYHVAQVGKWHVDVAEKGPEKRDLGPAAFLAQWGWELMRPAPSFQAEPDDKNVMEYTQAALHFLDTHRDKPSLAYIAHNTVHTKVEAPERLVKKYADKGYRRAGGPQPSLEDRPVANFLAMIDYLDESIGVLMAGIKRLQLGRETLVIFMSDNGGLSRVWDNSPLRRGKGSEYEGGIRVPLLMHWPERIKAGQEIEKPVHVVDLFPSLMEISGGSAGGHRLDGKSLLPLVDGRGSFEREAIYMHAPLYSPHYNKTPSSLIRTDEFKLIYFHGDSVQEADFKKIIPGERYELYRIREDISETRDLAASLREKTAELKAKLHAWLKETGAQMPVLNPNFDPAKWQDHTYSHVDHLGNIIARSDSAEAADQEPKARKKKR